MMPPAKFQFEQWVPCPLEQVFLFFANPNNLPKIMPSRIAIRIDRVNLVPPPENPEDHSPSDAQKPPQSIALLAGVGSEIVTSFRVLPYLPIRATWVAVITEFEWNHHFADMQKLGPFHSFHHRHELRAEVRKGINGTVVTDKVGLEVGYGWIGKTIEKLLIARQMEQMFQQRQQALARLLAI